MRADVRSQKKKAELAKRLEAEAVQKAEDSAKNSRLARLKDAFGVKGKTESSGAFAPVAMLFEPEVIQLAMQYPNMVHGLEATFSALVVDSERSKLILPAVNREKRTLQHALARSFGLDSQVCS